MNSRIIKKVLLMVAMVPLVSLAGFASKDVSAKASTYDDVYSVAKSKLGSRYVWGATGPNVFDCSGFTQYVYKKSTGKTIARTAQAQYNSTKKVSYGNLQKGDLVYFGGSSYSISHVGLYIGNGNMIDAQNRGVIVESINSPWWHKVGYSRPANLDSSTSDSVYTPNIKKTSFDYSVINETKDVKNSPKDNFYNHVLSDSKYKAKLTHYGKTYAGKTITTNMKATDARGNSYYRCYRNGVNVGWIKASSLSSNVTYTDVKKTMTVKNAPASNFYNHVTDTKYSVKKTANGAAYAGKTVTIDSQGIKSGWSTPYYRCSYNGKLIGWIYGTSLS